MNPSTTVQKVKDRMAIEVDLQYIADFFELGKVEGYSKSIIGRTNSTYFVTMQDGTEYAFRILRDLNVPLLENEKYIQQQLIKRGVKTSEMLVSRNGEYLCAGDNRYATVSKKLAGQSLNLPTSGEQSYLMGEILSKFHIALMDSTLPFEEVETSLGRERLEEKITSLPSGEHQEALVGLIKDSPFEVQDHSELPKGLIHGDLHVNNVLFDDKQVYVLDLQSVKRNLFILDIGRSVADVCSFSGRLERRKVEMFLEGYEKNRQLTTSEKQLLSKSIAYGAITASAFFFGYGDHDFALHFLNVGRDAGTMKGIM